MSVTSSERHRERRRKIEEERAERRRLEQEAEMRRRQKKKSSEIPVCWRYPKGLVLTSRETGEKITLRKPFFYFGSNMKDAIAPNIPEPSLINPVEAFSDTSESAEPLGDYPMFQFMSDEQRRGYLDFLASNRDQVDDIGYVFLYLYGIERRLIIDSAKPGTVEKQEREDITKELLRLHRCFAERSRSMAHYIDMLLLYDGTVFEMLPEDEIRELLELDISGCKTHNKNRQYCENSDSMSYLIVSRMLEHSMQPSIWDIAAAAKGRFMRSSNAAMLGISTTELYDEKLDRLLMERLAYVDMSRMQKTSARNISAPSRPVYFPSSPMIRKHKDLPITSAIALDPEDRLPLKAISDMIVACKKDIDECESVLSTSSLRDIDKVQLDALISCSSTSSPLQEFLKERNGATYVPIEILSQELKQRFGAPISYTSKGILSTQTQQLIAISAAMLGWQAMLPDVVEGAVSSFWRIDEKSKIVMFERGTAHNKKNGKRCIGPVFGGDESSYSVVVPGSWMKPVALAFVYAWFLGKLPSHFDKGQLTTFLSKYYPSFSTKSGNKKNQIAFFFSLLHATYSLKLSTHGIKKNIEMIDFAAVQELLFTLCDSTFGNLLPEDVMEVLEEVYKKAGKDPSKILYDYHAGTYQASSQSNMGFVIDEEKFAETMADTSSVQDMLAGAMDTDIEFDASKDQSSEAEAKASESAIAESPDGAPSSADEAAGFELSIVREEVEGFFADTDEKPTSELLGFIIDRGYASTNAEAMGVVADINSEAGEGIVEIDGADAYWNG